MPNYEGLYVILKLEAFSPILYLQILMSVLKAWSCVPLMPLVPTLREATTVRVTLVTVEMDSHVTVRSL